MKKIETTTAFNKAIKKVAKYKNFKKSKFDRAITQIQSGEPLDATFKDHKAVSHSRKEWGESRIMHVVPDIVVVYRVTDDSIILQAIGSHSDLFENMRS